MAQELTILPRGLDTNSNDFTAEPGSFTKLNNVVISRPGIIEPRPGMYGDVLRTNPGDPSTDVTRSFDLGDEFNTVHYVDEPGQPYFINSITGRFGFIDMVSSTSSYTYASCSSIVAFDKRLRSTKFGDNIYLTGKDSIKRLEGPVFTSGTQSSVRPDIFNAGISPMFMGDISDASGQTVGSAIPTDSQVGYRAVIQTKDQSQRLHVGTPSNKSIFVNKGFAFDAEANSGIVTCSMPIGSDPDKHDLMVGDWIEIRKSFQPPNVFPTFYQVLSTGSDQKSFVFDAGDVNITFDKSQDQPYRIGRAPRDVDVEVIMPVDYPDRSVIKLYRSKPIGDSTTTPSEEMGLAYESNPIRRYRGMHGVVGTDRTRISLTASTGYGDGDTHEFQVGDTVWLYTNITPSGTNGYITAGLGTVESTTAGVNGWSSMVVHGPTWAPANTSYSGIPVILRQRTITDTIATGLLGEIIYTAPSVEGPQAANDQPPAASCLESFNGSMFMGNTCTRDYIEIQLMGVPVMGALDFFYITVDNKNYTVLGSELPADFYNQGVEDQIEQFCNLLLKKINSTHQTVRGFYISSADVTTPGQLVFESYDIDKDGGKTFVITMLWYQAGTPKEVVTFPPTWKSAFTPAGDWTIPLLSTRDRFMDGLYFSKSNEPEAVPALNYFRIGQAGKRILNMKALQNALIVFKEDGAFKVIGGDPASFIVEPLDQSLVLLAPDSVARYENQLLALCELGVAEVSEQAGAYFSQKVDDKLRRCMEKLDRDGLETWSFGCIDISGRKYILRIAASDTVANEGTAQAPEAMLSYDLSTKTWSSWSESQSGHRLSCMTYDTIIDRPVYLYEVNEIYMLAQRADFVSDVFKCNQWTALSATLVSGTTYITWDTGKYEPGSPAKYNLLYETGSLTSVSSTLTPALVVDEFGNAQGDYTSIVGQTYVKPFAIKVEVEWAGKFAQNPGQSKRFRESSVTYGSLFYMSTSSFTWRADNEAVGTAYHDISECYSYPYTSDVNPFSPSDVRPIIPVRMLVPRNCSRTSMMTFNNLYWTTGNKGQILFFGTVFEDISTRIGKK